ncbi:hypothetical protein [Tepidiforma sp.]|nr:hypothetical protein [Tepidiforma sp.]
MISHQHFPTQFAPATTMGPVIDENPLAKIERDLERGKQEARLPTPQSGE